MPTTSRRLTRMLIGAVAVTSFLQGAWPARGGTTDTGHPSGPCLQTTQILNLAQNLDSTVGAPDSYAKVAKAAFDFAPGDTVHMRAFEENGSFVYAVAGMQSHKSVTPDGQPPEKITHWVRRLIILNASTFIVDDEFLTPISPGMIAECISSPSVPQVSGGEAHITEGPREISARILFPSNAV